MSNERNATKAGLFILTTIALIVGVILAIQGGGHLSEPRRERAVRFKLSDDLGGLRAGDDVRVGGYKVGTVRSIEPADLDGADPHLLVKFSMPTRYKLRADGRVGVQVTLTGAACLNVESLGSPDQPETANPLPGRPDPKSAALAALANAGPDLAGIARDVRTQTVPRANAALDSFKQTGDAGRALVGDVHNRVEGVVTNYNKVAVSATGALDSVHDMIGPTTGGDFHGTMSDIHEMTADLRGKLPAMIDKVNGALDGTRSALEQVQQTVENTKEISASVRTVIAGNKGKLEGVIASVKTTGDNLKAASSEIRRSPWRLLYKPGNGEVANLNLYDSARQFADGANELNDAAQALRDAANSKQTDPEQMQKLLNRLEKTFVNFHQVEQKLWTDVKE